MRIEIELNCQKNVTYLNFWDADQGYDVCCEIRGDKLILGTEEITLSQFVEMVKRRRRRKVKA